MVEQKDEGSLGLGLFWSLPTCHVQTASEPLLCEKEINFYLTLATANLDFLLYAAEPILPDITQSHIFKQDLKYNVRATDNTKDLF